jgi:hypothetical protein
MKRAAVGAENHSTFKARELYISVSLNVKTLRHGHQSGQYASMAHGLS